MTKNYDIKPNDIFKFESIINCCTVVQLHDFAESPQVYDFYNSDNNKKFYNSLTRRQEKLTVNIIKQAIAKVLHSLLDFKAIIIATTNRNQKITNKALQELGFKHTKWVEKEGGDSDVRLWWLIVGTNRDKSLDKTILNKGE